MKIAIASGKGGTGKTTVATNLALANPGVGMLLDSDVEEPNCHLFLPSRVIDRQPIGIPVPEVDARLCDHCGACARLCQFKAIVTFGTIPLVFPEMCHGCGGCARICPRQAISLKSHLIGAVETREVETADGRRFPLVQGRLNVGQPMSPPLIRAVRRNALATGVTLIDAPPGTSCPVIAAVDGCDAVVLVTEPTPFGLHDLRLAVATMRQLRLRIGVIVNRAEPDETSIGDFCRGEGLPVLASLPYDRRVAEAYSRGELAVATVPDMAAIYRQLYARILELANARSEVADAVPA